MSKNDLLGKTVVWSRDGDTYIVTGTNIRGFPDRVRCMASWIGLSIALPIKELTVSE